MTYELWIGNEVLAYGYSEDALRAFIATTGYAGIVYNSNGFDVTAAFDMKNADGIEYPTEAAVICREHGLVSLTDAEYERQMAHPDALWTCPTCGRLAEWDDDCPASNPREDALHS